MARAKTKPIVETEFVAPGKPLDFFRVIPITDIIASKTNPRKVFHEKPLDELVSSIKAVGILEPILVRACTGDYEIAPQDPMFPDRWYVGIVNSVGHFNKLHTCYSLEEAEQKRDEKNGTGKFEIIAGERRFRAALKAGLSTVPCIVKSLTDEQVFEVQFEENMHREELEPMDEARALKFYMDSGKLTIEELAARRSKDVRYIAQRLKLNDLIPECQKAMDENKLPVTHAYLICRYQPADQKHLIKHVYGKDFANADGYTATSYNLKQTIANSVEMKLSGALFDLNSKKLHPEGLTCIECPQRAGSNPALFELDDPKNDRCTNRTCFKQKTENHWQNMLDAWTAKGKKRFGEDYQAIKVFEYGLPNDKFWKDAVRRSDGIWKDASVRLEDNGSKVTNCASAEHALLCSSWQEPKTVQICRDQECKDHWKIDNSQPPTQITRGHNEAGDPVKLEERFACNVAMAVGQRVVFEAAEKLAVEVSEVESAAHLAGLAWNAAYEYTDGQDFADAFVSTIVGSMPEWIDDWELVPAWLQRKFTAKQLGEFLFVLSWLDRIQTNRYNYRSQGKVIQLAEVADLNYRLYDAEARLAAATDPKHVKKLEAYLADVKAGKDTPVPRLFSKKWKPDDSIREYKDEDFKIFEPEPVETDDENFDS